LLSCLLEHYKTKGDDKTCEKIKRLSPVAWRHINLVGKFEFLQNKKTLDIQEVTATLVNNTHIDFAAVA